MVPPVLAAGSILDPIYTVLGTLLTWFYAVVPSYMVAIILLTVAVRLILFPLTAKQAKSMQAMQRVQPELKRLQQKYKNDRQKLNEEMMKLYKEHKVNPLGGCLPLVLQLPVFLALYRVFAGCGKTIRKACAPGYVGVKYLPANSALARAIRVAGEERHRHAFATHPRPIPSERRERGPVADPPGGRVGRPAQSDADRRCRPLARRARRMARPARVDIR